MNHKLKGLNHIHYGYPIIPEQAIVMFVLRRNGDGGFIVKLLNINKSTI